VLRFTYGGSERARTRVNATQASLYKLTGNKELRPSSIRDDGSKTYIQWDRDQPIPGVFALDRLGREEMVDGYMRDGTFTIDRIHDRLVFRIDDIKAEAARPSEKSRK
jgi:type IV secretion system protein VirB9